MPNAGNDNSISRDTLDLPDDERPELPPKYHHQVIEQGTGIYKVHYDGDDHADAMAKWSELIGNGVEYVVLESLRRRPVVSTEAMHGYIWGAYGGTGGQTHG